MVTRLLLLLRAACERVCLSDRAKLVAPIPRPEPLGPRQLLPVPDFPLHELQRQLAGQRSWDFQF
jgi:hypothetical protein